MKPTTFTIILLFLFGFSYSQNYTPFPTKNIVWKQDCTWKYGFTNTNICETKTIETIKDTLIDSIKYHKLILSTLKFDGNFNRPCTDGIQTFTQKTFGFFRNDSINKKVWLRLPNSQSDTIWFDFNYAVGDTLRPTYAIQNNPSTTLIITKIDSILFGNKYRKAYLLNDSSCLSLLNPVFGLPYPSQLIEGIGSTNGIDRHNYNCYPAGGNHLACVQINGLNIYPDTSSCILVTNLKNHERVIKPIKIYPNPSNGQVFIKNLFSTEGNIKVMDIHGRLIHSYEKIPEKINLPNSNGLYFILIQTDDGRRFVEKIVRK